MLVGRRGQGEGTLVGSGQIPGAGSRPPGALHYVCGGPDTRCRGKIMSFFFRVPRFFFICRLDLARVTLFRNVALFFSYAIKNLFYFIGPKHIFINSFDSNILKNDRDQIKTTLVQTKKWKHFTKRHSLLSGRATAHIPPIKSENYADCVWIHIKYTTPRRSEQAEKPGETVE